jgi:hypothetical protein
LDDNFGADDADNDGDDVTVVNDVTGDIDETDVTGDDEKFRNIVVDFDVDVDVQIFFNES